jgi:hypothetical protein
LQKQCLHDKDFADAIYGVGRWSLCNRKSFKKMLHEPESDRKRFDCVKHPNKKNVFSYANCCYTIDFASNLKVMVGLV